MRPGFLVAAVMVAAFWTGPLAAQEAEPGTGSAAEATAEPNAEVDPGQAADGDDQDEAPEDVELRDPSEVAPGTRLHGALDVLANYTDNFFYNAEDPQGAFGVFVTPSVSYGSASPRFRSNSTIGGTFAFFSAVGESNRSFEPGSDDRFQDLRGSTSSSWKVASAHRLGYDIALSRGHDPFGLVRTEEGSSSRTLDRWVDQKYQLEYRYGAPRSPISVENKATVYNKAYHNNRCVSTNPQGVCNAGTLFLDYDQQSLDSNVLYHYSPKTHFQLGLVATQINFDRDFPNAAAFRRRDANEFRVRTGVRWVATVKTSGDFRIGYSTRRYQDSSIRSTNRFDWMIGADWSPITRTVLQAQTGRQSVESYNEASYIDTTFLRVTWKQEWLPRVTTQASVGYAYADFVNTERSDRTLTFNVRGEYRMFTRVTLFGGYDLETRGASGPAAGFLEYDRNTVYVGLRASY